MSAQLALLPNTVTIHNLDTKGSVQKCSYIARSYWYHKRLFRRTKTRFLSFGKFVSDCMQSSKLLFLFMLDVYRADNIFWGWYHLATFVTNIIQGFVRYLVGRDLCQKNVLL